MEIEAQWENANAQVGEKSVQGCRDGRPLGVSDQLLLTVAETSQILRLSRSRVYELLYSGVLPSVKIGSSRRVRRADLEWFVNHLEEAS